MRSNNDQISPLVHFVRLVLAAGVAGVDSLSDYLAHFASISYRWHRGGRGVGISLGGRHVAGLRRTAADLKEKNMHSDAQMKTAKRR